MGEPLLPDRVFDFPMDKPHLAYVFFAPGLLPGYAGNPNNMHEWIEADVPLLRELAEVGEPLGAKVDEPMVDPVIDEIAKPIVEVEEQMVTPVMDVKEGLAVLFGDDDDSGDDDSEAPEGDEEVWEMNEEWLMAPVTPPLMPVIPPPSTYEVGAPSTAAEGQSFTLPAHEFPVPPSMIEDLCTRIGNLEYGHEQLAKKVIKVSDAEVADDIANGEISRRESDIEGQVQVVASQMVQVVGRLKQVDTRMEQDQQDTTQRDEMIFELSQHVQTL
nr:hypothetical protein [Tanacetum cinerariifolium]